MNHEEAQIAMQKIRERMIKEIPEIKYRKLFAYFMALPTFPLGFIFWLTTPKMWHFQGPAAAWMGFFEYICGVEE